MKSKTFTLPVELESFVDAGNTTLACKDGDWDLRITPKEDSPFSVELPLRSLMIAENGCGDCLFLKISTSGKVDSKVFVFWHEENQCKVFAKHVRELTAAPKESRSVPNLSAPMTTISIRELDKALSSPDVLVRSEALDLFAKTQYGIDALPVLRKALDNDWVAVVIRAAECIGKLGPVAASCSAGQSTNCRDQVDLQNQLMLTGSRMWSYSGYLNCYGACLDALVHLDYEGDYIVDFVHDYIGLSNPDDLIRSLKALKSVGSPRALNLVERAAVFWLPELNMKYAKQVQKILVTK